ncbi:hypothetical protein Glove_529g39 [Diversispora epigaea]|uniref:Uncharacterized protein n=1 Tax=Diversispora epigaea TaxID=1348612 RepID=A0A397GJD3_9GLOM|nr:hypothetical protein Glove_529g39 [Diversispora epigaea]
MDTSEYQTSSIIGIKRTRSSEPKISTSNLIRECEVRNLILSRKLQVRDLIQFFKSKLKEEPRNKERLISITKDIAAYKEGYLVLKNNYHILFIMEINEIIDGGFYW